jgi:hypothetical protein
MYNLLYLAKGRFPWFSEGGNKPAAKTETILQMKETIKPNELYKGLPSINLNLINLYRGVLSRI